ncbi:MAG: beta strand repeat-containing protein [Desulfuromonas sp.]
MALTTTQQQDIIKYCVGLFNAAPGGYMTELAQFVIDGGTPTQMAENLANGPTFKGLSFAYSDASTNEQFVDAFFANLLGGTVTGDALAWANDWALTRIEQAGRAVMMVEAIDTLALVEDDNTAWTAARDLQVERIATATEYTITNSGTSTDLDELQGVVAGTTPVVGGETFTLTTGIDTVTGTSGNDTILGDFTATASINAGDQISAGAGTDTLKLYGTFASANMPLSITGVENLVIAADTGNASVNLSSWTKANTGIESVTFDNVASMNTQTITTTAGQSVSLATGPSMVATAGAVTWAGSATDTTLNLTLNGYQGAGSEQALTVTGAANTTLNVVANGTAPTGQSYANQISTFTAPATATKMVITGAGGLEVSTNTVGTKLAEIDASATTKGVSMVVDGTAAALKFTGGTGNDTVTFGTTNTFTTADTVVGGDGTDTLEMQRAQSANTSAAYTNITGFETLKVTDATTAADVFDLDHFGVQNINFKAAATATTTVKNMLDNATVTLGTTSGVALLLKTNTTADDLTVKVGGAAVTYTIDSSHFENLKFDTSAATGASTFAITDPQMKSVTLVNTTAAGTNPDFAVNLGTLGVVVDTVDVSAFKAATATNGVTLALSGSAVNGATVTGSGNNDTITGSSQDDSITLGEGADTVTAGAGNDTITLTETTAAIDNVIFSAAASNGVDTLVGFAEGTGIDTITLVNADTTVATSGGAAVLGASTAALVTGGGAFTTGANTTTSDVVEITTILDTAVTLSATSTGADLLQALSSDTTAAANIAASTVADKVFFLVYQNEKAFLFHGDSAADGTNTSFSAADIRLVGVINEVANGGIAAGDILMAV